MIIGMEISKLETALEQASVKPKLCSYTSGYFTGKELESSFGKNKIFLIISVIYEYTDGDETIISELADYCKKKGMGNHKTKLNTLEEKKHFMVFVCP